MIRRKNDEMTCNQNKKYCKEKFVSPFLDYTLYILHENIYT